MFDVRAETVVRRPQAEVAAFCADPENGPRWRSGLATVRTISPGRIVAGSLFEVGGRILGRTRACTYQVIAHEPGRRLVVRTGTPFALETTYLWEGEGPEATRMVLRTTGQPRGLARLTAAAKGRALRREIVKDLRRLAIVLEFGGAGR
ncbi:hypothetical protein NCCP1664_14150 [Zafaria cholistanensis]|uniref:Uncharacterized protein n=1 Tax=Zafaria cholistanensis TaxID=1682741 RepID=A0A5A7NSW5_9MICC|nr:SRPBCC family protein [Zafaria cholistanensis]GER22918.1 hypothetical protein NCCP1664_14150 [Zafaria cholistanensis]